jgi:homospermidine synthase
MYTNVIDYATLAKLDGPLVVVGFGSIGKGVLPLILRHIDLDRSRVTVIDPDDSARAIAEFAGVRFEKIALKKETLREQLAPFLGAGGFLVNVSVEVSSIALIELCREAGMLYIDTCIEPWPGVYTDASLTISQRSNYAMREAALALRKDPHDPTAVIAHGANPGMVSHFVKRALMTVARDTGARSERPKTREEWAQLARTLGIKGVHVAERDTQRAEWSKEPDQFINTWSVVGFISEGLQPAELGWGTHEKVLPAEGRRHEFGCDAAIYLERPGAGTRVRSWVPSGPLIGYLIPHNEAISISDYFTVRENGHAVYRPTCHYAYHPCDDAILSLHELQGNSYRPQSRYHLLNDDIVAGIDELGVLLYGHDKNAYWYGSQLSISEARKLAPYQNATALQVTAAVLAGMVWAIENPRRSVVEADEMDEERILGVMEPYLGTLFGAYTDWTPLTGRNELFPEDTDPADAWQFRNTIVR